MTDIVIDDGPTDGAVTMADLRWFAQVYADLKDTELMRGAWECSAG